MTDSVGGSAQPTEVQYSTVILILVRVEEVTYAVDNVNVTNSVCVCVLRGQVTKLSTVLVRDKRSGRWGWGGSMAVGLSGSNHTA